MLINKQTNKQKRNTYSIACEKEWRSKCEHFKTLAIKPLPPPTTAMRQKVGRNNLM